MSTQVASSDQPSQTTVQFKASMDPYQAKGAKSVSPAAERNKQPILEVLQRFLPVSTWGMHAWRGHGWRGMHGSTMHRGACMERSCVRQS